MGDELDPWDEKNNAYWIINKDHYFDKTERFTGAINLRADIAPWWFINYRLGVDTYNQVNSSRVAANGVVKQVWQKGMMSDNMLKYTYMSHNGEVRSPCAWRGGARPGSRVTGGD